MAPVTAKTTSGKFRKISLKIRIDRYGGKDFEKKKQGRQRHRKRIPGNIWSAGDGISYIPPEFAMVVFIIVNSVLTVHVIGVMVDAKMHQNAHICMLQFKIFVGEGLQRLSPNFTALGTPALRASRASLGASIVPTVC